MKHHPSTIDVLRSEEHIRSALAHPAFSDWLKSALRGALDRDPLVVANDLELLMHLLRPWAEARLSLSTYTTRPAHSAAQAPTGELAPAG
ncbi:MAG: hypothetical protein ACP5PN_09960 [Steroidobacteraceae bacterium]